MALTGFTYILSWSDFTNVPVRPHGVSEDAQIHPEIRPSNFSLRRNGRLVTIADVDIDIALVANDCWVLSRQTNNSNLLRHEQGHYDIIALSARELFRNLIGLSASSAHALQTRATQLQEGFQRRVTRVDARYDTQTNHSQNTAVQQTWDQRIAAEKQRPDGSIDNLPL